MNKAQIPNYLAFKLIVLFLLTSFVSNAQIMQVEVIGGAVVTQGSTITINAGTSLDFRITNIDASSCKNSKRLKIQDVDISNTAAFGISPNNPKKNIKQISCNGNGNKKLDFEIENTSPNCSTASTLVTIEIKNQADFTFTLEVTSSPEIYVLGGDPWQDIYHGDTTTSDYNGTYFGIVDEGNTVTRAYIVANIGSCNLDVTAVASSNPDFIAYSPYGYLPPTVTLPSYYYTVIYVTFTAPVGGTGTQSSVISISNTDNTTFTFTVEAEMFNENIPGPGGVTADFRLWLKSTRGIVKSGTSVTDWMDLGTNGKDATADIGKEPTFLDTPTDNINFNPVVKFENDGGATEQYMYNATNGFYSQDVFIVMMPDATMTSASSRNTIFAGISTGTAGDITGIGLGDYSSEFTNETLSYNQNISGGGSYNGEAEISSTYSKAGIINVRNNATPSPTGQDILYNSDVLSTSTVNDIGFVNVGSPGPPTVLGTEYWIGRNYDIVGSLNGRVAEIFTFAERLTDADRQKVESYLGIKFGITLGASTEATKDYINSWNTVVWDVSANAGYNYDVAGIGRDSISDLNQKQSKSLNHANTVTIGLGGISATNSTNPNEFEDDGDFLVWGNNNGAFSGTSTNTVTITTGITTALTRIDRKWKIIESFEAAGGDVETIFLSIPASAFSSFTKSSNEEYVLIVADNANFSDTDIIDVIPLKSDGGANLQTWYDFHDTHYFTFGKAPNLAENHSINLSSGEYLVGESALNLNSDSFTISAWIKAPSNASTRTIMAKGSKLQLRLNAADRIEVFIDDAVTPKYTSDVVFNDNKWHQTTFVYHSGSIYLYVDGILDKSVQDVVHPSPNYNNYSIGAVFVDKNTVLDPYIGSIDEVYVWDTNLTENQIRYLMNQEVERLDISGTDYVSGKVLPYNASSNEATALPWSELRAYYDFNSFYGSTVEGLTDTRNFLRLKYLNKDKTITTSQTIPAPYVTLSDGEWDNPATWQNGSDIVLPNNTSLDGSIIDWNIVEIGHDITSGNRDISLLGLKQTTGKLTIAASGDPQDETNTGRSLTISHYLEIDGVIDLVGESQLIQDEGSIIDADSGGYIERDQQGTANGFNYNYWSSSVGPIGGNTGTRGTGVANINANHTISGVLNDGTTSSSYQNITFSASHTAADSNTPTTPRTLSTYWMYKFYGAADDYNAWASLDETSSLLPGEGFTMKGTTGAADIINDVQNYVFKGLPNNGDITLPLDKSSGDVDRLVGNPYPSAIDATEFILDNLSIADGGNNASGTIINGALYFWDHFGEENSHNLGSYVGGYATRNLTGGAAAISNDSRINNTSDAGSSATGTKVPGQYIPVNQGFFVSTALDGFDNDDGVPISTVDGGNIVFKNTQRVFVREDAVTSIFMRSSKTKGNNSYTKDATSENQTIRLMYDSPKGYHRQIVIGLNEDASNKFDLGYDAFMIDVNEEDMYWYFDDNKFVIQGVNNFNSTQEFSLGLIVKQAGTTSIKLDGLENMNPNTALFIKDIVTGEIHQINNTPFETTLDPGTYNDRFKLVFQSKQMDVLTTTDSSLEDGFVAYYDSNSSEINIIKSVNSEVLDVTLYNLLGQKIKTVDFHSNLITIPVQLNAGVYILQFNTSKGNVGKRIIIE